MEKLLDFFRNLSVEIKGGIIGLCIPGLDYLIRINFLFVISHPFSILGFYFIWGDNSHLVLLDYIALILDFILAMSA